MKKIIYLFSAITTLLLTQESFAQIIAGQMPGGSFSSDPDIELSVLQVQQDTSAGIDLNCDNIPDLTFEIYHGMNSVDEASFAYVFVNDPSVIICADTSSMFGYKTVSYYNGGQLMSCTGAQDWFGDTILLGNFGCLSCPGPAAVTDKYIAYQAGAFTGWIRISLDIMGNSGSQITLSVTQIITFCDPLSVEDYNSSLVAVYPIPTPDGRVQFESKDNIKRIQVENSMGQIVGEYNNNIREIFLPPVPGMYFLRITMMNGKMLVKKISGK